MKNLSIISALCVLTLCVSSCDFFRALAGRPGSSFIKEKRARIEQVESRKAAVRDSVERVRIDSIARAERYIADSLYALDTLKAAGLLRKASNIKNIPPRKLGKRCYVVVGAFSKEANAERLAARYRSSGFEAIVFRYYSGLNAVLVSPCNRIPEVLDAYRSVMRLPYASKETWVLVNE